MLTIIASFCSSPTGHHADGPDCSFAVRYLCEKGRDLEVERCEIGCVGGHCVQPTNHTLPPFDIKGFGPYLLAYAGALVLIIVLLVVLWIFVPRRDSKTES